MASRNVEAFGRLSDAWNRRDLEAWLEDMGPGAELHPGAVRVEGGAYRGPEGARQFFADIDAAFDELVAAYDEVVEVGDGVLGLGRLRGRSKQGFPVDEEYGLLIRYRDGLIVWARSWFSHAEARAAAGLGDPD